jgi:thioredoxin 1
MNFYAEIQSSPLTKNFSPNKIKLFIYTDCFFCTKVISFLEQHRLLDQVELIDANVSENKDLLRSMTGKTQVPYLVDIDCRVAMLESADIIAYLSEKFHVKSVEPVLIPVPVNELKTYSSSTFLSEVQTSNKPVLILVATTWCPPCKKFKPIFEEVAEQMKDYCDFILIDGDLNEDIVTLLKVTSYPTLICYKKGQTFNPINYRTKVGLMELISRLLKD